MYSRIGLLQPVWLLILCLLSLTTAQRSSGRTGGSRTSGTSKATSGGGSGGVRYSEQTFIGTHNAVMVKTKENGFSVFGNQFHNVTTQLNAGIRMIQGQGHKNAEDKQIHICHTDCKFFDAGALRSQLGEVKAWLDQNPNEVVTLLWTNEFDNIPVAEWDSLYGQTGLAAMSFVPSRPNIGPKEWPRISEMVASNKRVVTFLSKGANEQAFPYILDEFNYMTETGFEITNANNFSCAKDRGNIASRNGLTLINHFLGTNLGPGIIAPNVSYAKTSNSVGPGVGNLLSHANLCTEQHGHKPNFLLVDFFDRGNPFQTADQLNQGLPTPSRTTPPSIAGTGGADTLPEADAFSGANGNQESFLWPIYLLCLVGSGMMLL